MAAAYSRVPKHWANREDAGRRGLMPPSREQTEPELDVTVDGIPGDHEHDVPSTSPNDVMAVPLLLRGGTLLGVLSLANHREAFNEGQRKKHQALDREVSISNRKKKVVGTAPGNEELGLLERPGCAAASRTRDLRSTRRALATLLPIAQSSTGRDPRSQRERRDRACDGGAAPRVLRPFSQGLERRPVA